MVQGSPPPIAVVYLAYLPYGQEPYDRFIGSLRRHDAGCEFELKVVAKGAGYPQSKALATRMLPLTKAPDDGLDLQTYLWVARNFPAQRYCFLNTNSEILDDGWLEKLNRHLGGGVGIVGATGSHGRNRHIKGPRYNPHVRTNAFMLERDLMLSLDWQEPIDTKDKAFEVEHGERSITNQIRERGLEAVVVGKDGRAFTVGSWMYSNTFWINDQENLLIADNATRKYQEAENGYSRRVWMRFAWG